MIERLQAMYEPKLTAKDALFLNNCAISTLHYYREALNDGDQERLKDLRNEIKAMSSDQISAIIQYGNDYPAFRDEVLQLERKVSQKCDEERILAALNKEPVEIDILEQYPEKKSSPSATLEELLKACGESKAAEVQIERVIGGIGVRYMGYDAAVQWAERLNAQQAITKRFEEQIAGLTNSTETTFLDRLKAEEAQLLDKITKLDAFIHQPKYLELGLAHRSLLKKQLQAMRGYQSILEQRIELIGHTPAGSGT